MYFNVQIRRYILPFSVCPSKVLKIIEKGGEDLDDSRRTDVQELAHFS